MMDEDKEFQAVNFSYSFFRRTCGNENGSQSKTKYHRYGVQWGPMESKAKTRRSGMFR